jgi:hypothetical protein
VKGIYKNSDSIKRPNLRIMDIEGQEVQAKGIHNIVNKIMTEKFPNLKKTMPYMFWMPPGHQTDLTKIELPHNILSLKQQEQRIEKKY